MPNRQTEITCIGISYIQPILDLYWKLSHAKLMGNSKIRVSPLENGYSVSIVALTAFCIESFLNNLKYRKKQTDYRALNFFKREYEDYAELCEKLNELFTLRNVIAHNYIWEIHWELDDDFNEQNIEKELMNGYGNRAFRDTIDRDRKVTKLLRLRIIPTRIGQKEAKQALSILSEFSKFLDNQGLPFISNQFFEFTKKTMKFYEIIELIKKTRNLYNINFNI